MLPAPQTILRRFTRRAYRVRGLARLAERVRIASVGRSQVVVIDDFDGDLKFRCFLNEHIGSLMYWRGCYSCHILALLDRILSSSMTFLDIGANQGEFTLFAAKRLSAGCVIAFEPVPYLYDRLTLNVQMNGLHNVIPVSKGVAAAPGLVPIYSSKTSFSDGSINEGLATLFATEERNTLLGTVPVIRLDDIVEEMGLTQVDVIKLDIEGAELPALQGGGRTIERFRPVVLLEVSDETCRAAGHTTADVLDYLSNLGYSFEEILEAGRTRAITRATLGAHQNLVAWPRLSP